MRGLQFKNYVPTTELSSIDVIFGAYGDMGCGIRIVGVDPDGDNVYIQSVYSSCLDFPEAPYNHAVSIGGRNNGRSLGDWWGLIGLGARLGGQIIRRTIGVISRGRCGTPKSGVQCRG